MEEENEIIEEILESTEEVDEVVEEIEEIETKPSFNGYHHDRDRLDENNIVNEVETSFLEYSMSVIASRALPDLRDGLKPVHRRILWSMYESGYTPDKPHRKSAKTVGEVMGNYHPHGDSSIYEAMVRMAQDFNQRYLLVDGHGNFGNIEGDGAAAMRYTEARLSKLSLELLRDINKETVDYNMNFDETLKEPQVLPSRYPNILVNGTMGIAVGMATNIPPHNLGEVIDGCIAYIDNPDIDTLGLMEYIKGPDFPTGAIILGNSGIKQAYETGRGSITIRSRATIEEVKGHQRIIITEVPYGVNTMDLKNKVAELVHNKIIDGISDYHTDLKDGVKITITLKRDVNAQVVLNNLYKYTQFQTSYGIILLMLDGLTPRTLGLKDIISKYIDHQKEVIIRRTRFDLKKSENRVHILEGYKIALDNIDEVIKIIKNAETDHIARDELIKRFGLSQIQADSILELKLRRLTGLERNKIEEELANLMKLIEELKAILASEQLVLEIIKKKKNEKFQIIWATGPKQFDIIKEDLNNQGININNIKNTKIVPYIYNMEELMNLSDLLVCRSGAMTITEIAIVGKPAIFIPLPSRGANRQEDNARVLEKLGAAKVILNEELTDEILFSRISEIIEDKDELVEMIQTFIQAVKEKNVSYFSTFAKMINSSISKNKDLKAKFLQIVNLVNDIVGR